METFRYSKDEPSELDLDLSVFKQKNENLNNSNFANLLSRSIRVNKEILPSVAEAIEKVFQRLNLENNFNFFVTADHYQANAACSLMSTSSQPDIIITSKLVELLSNEELQFVIGHEVAHYYYQHALYPSYQLAVDINHQLNLLNLGRSAEISADRIGFLACGSLQHSLQASLKLASGLNDKHLRFNFSTYLDQLRELESVGKNQSELWSTHPNFLIRIQALIWFSMSKEYHEFFGTKKAGVYDLETVDNKINNSIKKIVGNELELSNKEIYDRALLWGALKIYLSDKTFSKQEQEKFAKQFGGKKTTKILSLLRISNQDILDKKIGDVFTKASTLLKTDKTNLINDLKMVRKEAEGEEIKKSQSLNKLLNILGEKGSTNI